jgi:hypothetical protein
MAESRHGKKRKENSFIPAIFTLNQQGQDGFLWL